MTTQKYEIIKHWLPILENTSYLLLIFGLITLLIFLLLLALKKLKKLMKIAGVSCPILFVAFFVIYSVCSDWHISVMNYETVYDDKNSTDSKANISEIADEFNNYASSVIEKNKKIQEELPELGENLDLLENSILDDGTKITIYETGASLLATLNLHGASVEKDIQYITSMLVSLSEQYSGKYDSVIFNVVKGEEPIFLTNMTNIDGKLKIGAMDMNWLDAEYEKKYNEVMQQSK